MLEVATRQQTIRLATANKINPLVTAEPAEWYPVNFIGDVETPLEERMKKYADENNLWALPFNGGLFFIR